VSDNAAMKRAHQLLTDVEEDLFDLADKVKELLGLVMAAIHQLEADQPILSFIKPLLASC
jgi:hypothetical protein